MKKADNLMMRSLLSIGMAMAVFLSCLSWSGCGVGYLDGSAPPHHPGCENACFVDAERGIYLDIHDEEGGIRAWGRHDGGHTWDLIFLTLRREGEILHGSGGLSFYQPEDGSVLPIIWSPVFEIDKDSPHLPSCDGTSLSFRFIYDVPPERVEEGGEPEEIFSFDGTRVEDRTVCQ